MISERVDDIRLLGAQLARRGVRSLRHEYCPAHGYGVGLSLGWVADRWLTPILVGSGPSAAPCRTVGRVLEKAFCPPSAPLPPRPDPLRQNPYPGKSFP